MRTLTKTIGKKDTGGEPMPLVFRSFKDYQMYIRRSEVSVIAGKPGAGKSTLALAMALRMRQPTLYISADTNAHTMAMRLLSMIEGMPQQEAEKQISESPDLARQKLAKADHIFWSFNSNPSLRDIDYEVMAIEEMLGEPPALIVIDNLMDISMGGEEFSSMRSAMKELKFLARDTNAAVLILHHTKESFSSDPCPSMEAIQGMVNQIPALALTIGQHHGMMAVAPVKNRYGKADDTGKTAVWLQFNPEYMYIADTEEQR